MPKATFKRYTRPSTQEKSKAPRRLPNWVDLNVRGFFKDEVNEMEHHDAVSWLSSWKPLTSPLNLSYIKKNGDYEDEYVCKSKNWVAAKHKPYPKMR